jgi:hypothetical protein
VTLRDATGAPAARLAALSPAFAQPASDAPPTGHLAALYEKGKRQQWNASTDLDWNSASRFGDDLADDSAFALACFDRSPLSQYGRPVWNAFRWEFHAWMISQFVPGEQAALLASARLVDVVPDPDARLCLATQVGDEARHVEVFGRYVRERVPAPYGVSASLAALLGESLRDRRWDMTVLGMHILVETMALAAFRLADWTFHDELARDICRRAALDEARHVSVGVLSLRPYYAQLTDAERKEREEFLMEAAGLVRRRFQLEEIWQRMDIDAARGVAFAQRSPLMVQYRQVICAKLVSSVINIGLMSERLHERFVGLDLLRASRRPAGRVAATPRQVPRS